MCINMSINIYAWTVHHHVHHVYWRADMHTGVRINLCRAARVRNWLSSRERLHQQLMKEWHELVSDWEGMALGGVYACAIHLCQPIHMPTPMPTPMPKSMRCKVRAWQVCVRARVRVFVYLTKCVPCIPKCAEVPSVSRRLLLNSVGGPSTADPSTCASTFV